MATTDLTGISFQDQIWLSSFPLDRNYVFDYFALSPFYDRSCSNEQLRTRSIHPLDMAQLSKMTGIEYILHESQEPNLFILYKQKRESPEKVSPLCAYYVLDGVVYQAPFFYNVVCSRLVRTLHHISNAFSEVADKLEKVGSDTTEKGDDAKSEEDKKADAVGVKEVIRIEHLLARVLRKLPPAPAPPPLPPPPGGVPDNPLDVTGQQAVSSQQEAAQKASGANDQVPPLKKMKV